MSIDGDVTKTENAMSIDGDVTMTANAVCIDGDGNCSEYRR